MNDSIACSRRAALAALGGLVAACALPGVAAAAPALPGDSIYGLPLTLVDAEGRGFELASLQGEPVLASMFYTSCTMVCPMIFETVHATLRALPPAQRKAVRVLLVSFDPERDTTAALKKAFADHGCDERWTLARGDEKTARKVAALLGIQYRRLADGEFNHSTTIDLLDRQGRITARSGKLGSADAALVAAVRKTIAA
jgi:protein SCO1/2